MGTYTFLSIGDFVLSGFRETIPIEFILLFKPEDLIIREVFEEDEDTGSYQFVTTVREAKHRFDSRGIDLLFCKRLFESLQEGKLYSYQNSQDGNSVSTRTSFEEFLQHLQVSYHKANVDQGELLKRTWEDDTEFFLIRGMGSYHPDSLAYFGDTAYCVFLRCFLEVAPDDAIVELDFSELVQRGVIDKNEVPTVFSHYMRIMFRRIELDYKIYGFVIEDDPLVNHSLRQNIEGLNEDQFITHVLYPLLQRMGYERVRQVDHHGVGEFGSDILPFRYTNPFGTLEYYALQAKAVPIKGKSAQAGNAGELISQATQAFKVAFIDDLDNERKNIDKFIIATNKRITPNARTVIESAMEKRRSLIFLDIESIIELVKKYGLTQYILFSALGDTSL